MWHVYHCIKELNNSVFPNKKEQINVLYGKRKCLICEKHRHVREVV